ncbi:unnamed protein product [Heligmosomoides polygyrus]|uniref:CCHC-type domain-containing protein n=1 Tax=Heligmosomoides polygyrus TaxID=6339 RepID=A0A3P7ZT78_HELPZ|nr:unnamed protein product [Heligmosomoides polygyrus]
MGEGCTEEPRVQYKGRRCGAISGAPRAKENELLQEQGRRQQAELEELIRIKRQLAEREDEVARLRRQLVASGTPAKAGADEYSAEGPRQQWTVRAVDDRRALEDNDSPRSRESGRWVDGVWSERYLALPEVRPYSGEDPAYRFSAFLESFVLKYPRDSWGDAELGVLWSGLVEAMRQVCRAEWRHDRIVALGELKTLRKREGQGVADFCVELEQLTRRAHPHMDEVALDAERAQLLFEQLAHWGDSYHLMEALESENHAYDRLKQTALGIERRDLTLRRTGVAGRTGSGRSEERHKAKPPRGEAEPTPGKDGSEEPRAAAKGRRQLCYNCHEAGHLAKECPMKGTRSSGTSGRGVVPLSARLLQPACQAIYRTGAGTGAVVPCPLTGKKSTTVVNVFGRKWTGLLDTGSEVSIIPAKVLLKAKEDGHDIDREVVEHHLDPSMRVYDAAGKIMRFVTVVEVKLKEGSDYQREVVAKMLVSRATDDLIILGTNVLPSLGYELERRERDKPALGPETEMVENRYNENELPTDRRESKTACVARRTYLAPGAVVWVGLRGCDPKAEYMLASTHELIYSGVCSVGASGVVEVPVVNRSEEPAVLRAGEAVGRNATEELAAGRVDGTRTAMIVPAVLRVLKKAKRWQRTEVFYYWDFQDLHAGRTFMFDRRIKDVILVLPPAETGVGSWTALVDAVAVWLGAGGRVFLIAGPRTGDDTAWMRVTTQAREFLEKHLKPASHAQICDMLPRGMDVVDMNAPCAVLGIIENEELTVALKRACAFYMACRKQLSPWTQMEALPEVPRRRPPSVDKYPGIRSGRIGKRRCRSPPASCPLRVRH